MKRQQILENRRKWIDYLKNEAIKFKGKLENPINTQQRCCLGHACFVLGVKRTIFPTLIAYGEEEDSYCAPDEVISQLGLTDNVGQFDEDYHYLDSSFENLVDLNDDSNISHRQIGAFLESVINGGGPFLPLENFEE